MRLEVYEQIWHSFEVLHYYMSLLFVFEIKIFIFLYLSLDGFPFGEPVHVIALIGATFLRQGAAQLRVAPSHPRGASSSGVPSPPSSTSTAAIGTSGAAADADVPPPTASDDSEIGRAHV